MKILIVEPGKEPYPADIPNTLKAMQLVVGGLIDVVYLYNDKVGVVANDEGILMHLPFNRHVGEQDTVVPIVGTFFVCGLSDENFCGLTKNQINRYTEMLYYPEIFTMIDGNVFYSKIPVQYSVDSKTPFTPSIKKGRDSGHEK